MSGFQTSKTVKTRKSHQCHACLKTIPAGTVCENTTGRDDDFFNIYIHIECQKILDADPDKYLEDEVFKEGCLLNRVEVKG
jgi:hypothetical protein